MIQDFAEILRYITKLSMVGYMREILTQSDRVNISVNTNIAKWHRYPNR